MMSTVHFPSNLQRIIKNTMREWLIILVAHGRRRPVAKFKCAVGREALLPNAPQNPDLLQSQVIQPHWWCKKDSETHTLDRERLHLKEWKRQGFDE